LPGNATAPPGFAASSPPRAIGKHPSHSPCPVDRPCYRCSNHEEIAPIWPPPSRLGPHRLGRAGRGDCTRRAHHTHWAPLAGRPPLPLVVGRPSRSHAAFQLAGRTRPRRPLGRSLAPYCAPFFYFRFPFKIFKKLSTNLKCIENGINFEINSIGILVIRS
jgi:hypothetical protein